MVKKTKKKEEYVKSNYNDYVIAIDSSLTDTGVAVYSLSRKEIVFTGDCNTDAIRNVKKYRGYNKNSLKLRMISEYFQDLLNKFPPKIVILERGFAKFKKEVEALNQVKGVIYSVFWNYTQIEYAPSEVKAEILHGRATKEDLRDVLMTNVPEVLEDKEFYENDNISDAVAVLYTYLLKSKLIMKSKWDIRKYKKDMPVKRVAVKNKTKLPF